MTSFNPLSPYFFDISNGKPDLYGPFWIYTTLIFVLGASGNMCQYIQNPMPNLFSYNFDFIPWAASLVYTFGILVPIAITFTMRLFGSDNISYLQTICI